MMDGFTLETPASITYVYKIILLKAINSKIFVNKGMQDSWQLHNLWIQNWSKVNMLDSKYHKVIDMVLKWDKASNIKASLKFITTKIHITSHNNNKSHHNNLIKDNFYLSDQWWPMKSTKLHNQEFHWTVVNHTMNMILRFFVQLVTNSTTIPKSRNILKSIIFTTLINLNCPIWWIPMPKHLILSHHNNHWPTSHDFTTHLLSHKSFNARNLMRLITLTSISSIMRNLTREKVMSRSNRNLHNLLNPHFNLGQKTLIFTTVLITFSAHIIILMSVTLRKAIP